MDDADLDDVILYLLPHKGEGFSGAVNVIGLAKNKARLVTARHKASEQRDIHRQEREGTELPEEHGSFGKTDRLVVRFSHGARSSLGVVSGCAPNTDLAFYKMPGVSRHHLSFTFDDHNILIARDLGSTGGTKVTYNGERGQRLSNFDWPLVGPSIAKGEAPILNITNDVQGHCA